MIFWKFLSAQAGQKKNGLFVQETQPALEWAELAAFIHWFTDGEPRYGKALWALASFYLKADETHPDYKRRKVWREGIEVAMKIKSSQGQRWVEWVNPEHPFTTISPASDVHVNHCGTPQ